MLSTGDKKPSLTKRQREIYEFLREKILNRGYGPTVREIGSHFDIKSPNGVMCHLKALERKGLILREQNMSRAIQLTETPKQRMSVALMGTAVSGGPIQPSIDNSEMVDFSELFELDGQACLKVAGNAYSSIGILDGDFMVLNREVPPEAGSLVAALDSRQSVILLRVQEDGSKLMPAIPGGVPATTRQILGVLNGIIRRLT